MISTVAKVNISSYTVENIVLMNLETDPKDPNYIWDNVTSVHPIPEVGWTFITDGVYEAPTPMYPNDAYGNAISFDTDGVYDYYTPNGYAAVRVPAGTSQAVAYVGIAKSVNLAKFQEAIAAFVESRYSTFVRLNLIGIYNNAVARLLLNRKAYVGQLLTWQDDVISYASTYSTSIQALTNQNTIAATTWNFSTLQSGDPLISPLAAIQILT